MDWIKTVVSIKKKLSDHGFIKAVERINEAQMVLGTPGEMYLEVMNELLSIRKEGTEKEFDFIEPEVNQLLEYGRSIKYFNPTEDD